MHPLFGGEPTSGTRVRVFTRWIAPAVALAIVTNALAQAPAPLVSGVDLSARDPRVRPGDDFSRYTLGSWYASAQIPADDSEISVDSEVSARVHDQLRAIIESGVRQATSPQQSLIGALYASFMDEDRIESLDSAPLRADLKRIAGCADKRQFLTLMATAPSGFGTSLFSLRIEPDAKSSLNVVYVGQSGLGLANPDYYLSKDSAAMQEAYRDYIARTLRLIDYQAPDVNAAGILALETAIAGATWTQTQRRDIVASYNPTHLADLQVMAPGVNWQSFLGAAGIPASAGIVLSERSAVVATSAIYARTSLATLKAWQAFHTTDEASRYLSRRFVDNRFAFHGVVLTGASQLPARSKRGVNLIDANLGDALGHLYVTRHFSTVAKQQMESMIAGLRLAMAQRIASLNWMSEPTKRKAQAKLAAMRVFVGYPAKQRDYRGLSMDPQDLYGNIKRSVAFDWAYQCATLGKPLPPDAWGPFDLGITPQTVDAFNVASSNIIIFPAAFLQPPFFDPNIDVAHNYGAIGAVIGHEIIHGFDDQGRKIDASGKLRNWWSPEDAAQFERRAVQLAQQYDAVEVLPGMHVDGHQTMGENIADLGGLLVALDAYHASLGTAPAPIIDGLSGDQRVFFGWSQRWRRKMRDDALREQIAMNTHSPAPVRINEPLRDIDAWYAAFDVKMGDRNYLPPDQRVRIW
jgi:putative endopeptidase